MWLGSGSLHSHDFLKQGPFEICHNLYKCDVLRNLVPFVQFKKREKHPWRGVTFSKVALKVTLLHGCFSRFLNCTHGTKSRNASHSEFTFVSFLLMKVCLITIYNNESQVSLFKHLALIFPSRHLFVQNQQYKHQSNVSNMFKVNNKDTRAISMTSFWCLYCCL